jgi:putative hydroxymethylpyrimidine transport system ATP-binding protein
MTDPAATASRSVPGLIIEATQLTYNGIPLFQNLKLALCAGEWTGLLGPSGVGKSTLLRIAAGLGAGHGSYSARLTDGSALRNSVALMAQRDALLPWLSVLDNACLGARATRLANSRTKPSMKV